MDGCAVWQGTEDGAGRRGAGFERQSRPGKDPGAGQRRKQQGWLGEHRDQCCKEPQPLLSSQVRQHQGWNRTRCFPSGSRGAQRWFNLCTTGWSLQRCLSQSQGHCRSCGQHTWAVQEEAEVLESRRGGMAANLRACRELAACLSSRTARGWLSPQSWAFCWLSHPSTAFPAFASAGSTRLCCFLFQCRLPGTKLLPQAAAARLCS